jgi:hypothetical protein
LKRKYFLLVLVLILTIFLVGCSSGGIVIPATDEAKIKGVLYDYCLALNDQDWSKAKSYCIYGSEVYYNVCVKEDLINALYSYCNVVTLTYNIDIINIDIDGNYAQVYIHTTALLTACGYYETSDNYEYGNLQKVGSNWKLY